jgi:hypothetical protein
MDNQTALRLKKKLAQEFRDQLTVGSPTNEDEAGLRRLAAQIRAKKVIVKLFLRHTLSNCNRRASWIAWISCQRFWSDRLSATSLKAVLLLTLRRFNSDRSQRWRFRRLPYFLCSDVDVRMYRTARSSLLSCNKSSRCRITELALLNSFRGVSFRSCHLD